MVELGKIQRLKVVQAGQEIILEEPLSQEKVKLDENNSVGAVTPGQEIELFVYRKEEDFWIASRHRPFVMPGEAGFLEAVKTIASGTFFDWGLAHDLFMPLSCQRRSAEKPEPGRSYLVGVTVGEKHKIVGTMDIHGVLGADSPYRQNDTVEGIVYEIHPELGVFVAVDGRFHGLIPGKECYNNLEKGQTVKARVNRVREDGKLELSLRQQSYRQLETDAREILEKMEKKGGYLPLHDKSDPEEIKKELHMSKAAFKRAVGSLWKSGKIERTEKGIKLP